MNENPILLLRQQIDAVDSQILALLNRRAHFAQQIAELKNEEGAVIFRPEREAQILQNIAQNNPGPLQTGDLQTIFQEIISACRALERRLVIAFLGPAGTFSEQAMYKEFGHAISGHPCQSIEEVFRTTEAKEADFGIVPIENSTEGAIHQTLDSLLHTSLLINSELSIPIRHHLLTKTGTMEKVQKICAHTQALSQCQLWLSKHYPHIEQQPVASNGKAAQLASENPTIAAIAGEIAARQYALQSVKAHIQDSEHNQTRFIILGSTLAHPSYPGGQDHTSFILSFSGKAGSLETLLTPLAQHGLSMVRLLSRPTRLTVGDYYFYIDIPGHLQDEKVAKVLASLKENARFFKVLGSYPAL